MFDGLFNEFATRIRGAQIAGAGFVLALGACVVGLVWLSICAVDIVSTSMGRVSATALVGGLFCLPLVLMLIMKTSKQHKDHGAQAFAPPHHPSVDDQLMQLTRITEKFVDRSPLVAVAIAALAGIIAVRFPAALSLLIQVISGQKQSDI